jgi:threonine/homoserine/homoserine lactone efflux protein
MLSNSATHGFQRSTLTAAGDLTANALQMLAAGFGLAAILAASANALLVVKWLGVAYLIWLGFRMIRKAKANGTQSPEDGSSTSLRTLWLQGFITSASNPKAVVFFAALFPQFINPESEFASQFVLLSVTYIVVDGLFLSAYGIGASWVASRFKGETKAWIERVGGTFMIGAAILLGLKTVSDR